MRAIIDWKIEAKDFTFNEKCLIIGRKNSETS